MIRLSSATPQEILADRAQRLANAASVHEPVLSVDLLCFRIADARYAIETQHTFNVIQSAKPATLPGAPEHIIGIVGVQGEIIPLVDLARFWNASVTPSEAFPIVVLGRDAPEFAVAIDGFEAMVSRSEADVAAARPLEGHREFVSRVLGDGVALLDGKALLEDPRFSISPPSSERGT